MICDCQGGWFCGSPHGCKQTTRTHTPKRGCLQVQEASCSQSSGELVCFVCFSSASWFGTSHLEILSSREPRTEPSVRERTTDRISPRGSIRGRTLPGKAPRTRPLLKVLSGREPRTEPHLEVLSGKAPQTATPLEVLSGREPRTEPHQEVPSRREPWTEPHLIPGQNPVMRFSVHNSRRGWWEWRPA